MVSSPIISWQTEGEKVETVADFIFLDSKITADSDCSHEIKDACSLKGKLEQNLDSVLKSKGLHSQSYGFSSSPVWMWELDHKEDRAPKNAAAAKSLQSCPTLSDPIDDSPPGSPVPGILQCRKMKSESEVAQPCPTFSDPWAVSYQVPLSMGFSRQEYWSGVPLPSC